MKMNGGSKDTLLNALRVLQNAGFLLSEVESSDCCFEAIAKKGGDKLLLKTSDNIDHERKESAEDLVSFAMAYSASPVMIGLTVHNGALEEDTLYERYGVNVVSPRTFSEAMNGKLPSVYFKRGGLYFKVNGRYLHQLREELGLSLGDLAKKIGVSRKAIYEYETGGMGATLETVAKIEEVLDRGITAGIDIFEWQCAEEPPPRGPSGPVARQLHGKLKEIGCKAITFNHAPVDVHARNVGVSFLVNDRDSEDLRKRVVSALEMGKLLEMEPVLVASDERPRDLDITVIRIDEIKKLESLRDLERLLDTDRPCE
jgi:putative transcriptional regulator